MKCKLFLLIIFLGTSIFICTRQNRNEIAASPVWNNQSSSIQNAQAATGKYGSTWYASVQVQSYCQSAYSNRYQQQSHALTQNQYLNALFKSSGVKTTQDCQQIFHKTPEQIQALFSLEPVKFKHDLLQDESLPNDLIWKIFNDILKKTIWPTDWTSEQIMNAIKQAWHNQTLKVVMDEGLEVYGIIGISSDGIEIEMILKILKDNKIKLKTAYPHFKKFSGLV